MINGYSFPIPNFLFLFWSTKLLWTILWRIDAFSFNLHHTHACHTYHSKIFLIPLINCIWFRKCLNLLWRLVTSIKNKIYDPPSCHKIFKQIMYFCWNVTHLLKTTLSSALWLNVGRNKWTTSYHNQMFAKIYWILIYFEYILETILWAKVARWLSGGTKVS